MMRRRAVVLFSALISIFSPAGAERVSLSDATLIAGLMDLHSHLLLHPYNETRGTQGDNARELDPSTPIILSQAEPFHAIMLEWHQFLFFR
jgi:imidazolonepropionase-like amidohydrolase